ncbi:ribulose-phosphate 3-epimerase [Candidatus Kinetoplastidibacterium crithidiae]|uniref:Ribulose-phosphate 3-epimerase n=1 Tax=Candidatus Kinetoplastidibacterium crithidiae TCC036E TaxID=1208918 RepID=M1LNT7_9PROT|nr:ribulose-phosphate 3-epimerase [Candidatus Kinetoplastibacterium crithidii]AFZ83069.1 ribulose-phosphate 3-epimerase [Candidatus Kinetoplastibacterium crithidii (ex Angomonas deanei ATCC 30255)]AGF47347.1 ribulose-phosphate 3-epimerase [Candidatus Kinetoplastibacterium crithidii TCC036E]
MNTNNLPALITPSILSADFSKLGEEIRQVTGAGADWIHIDVMDNHYVPNLTIGPMVCKAIKKIAKIPLDIHLMVENVDLLIPEFSRSGADIITIHPETSKHLDRTLSLIKDCNCKAGLALNPASNLQVLDYIMDKIDLILVMSVNPGFGGQKFLPMSIKKIKDVRTKIDEWSLKDGHNFIMLQVDGGVNIDNIAKIRSAGANAFVSGSAIFESGNYKETINAMKMEIQKSDDLKLNYE